jgi:Protein of unknown function (DUF3800)
MYMDESGIHDDSPVVTVAAYLGRPRDWAEFTKRWNVAKRPIRVYHATDAQNLHGEFEGWDETDRDAVVKRVLPVIANTGLPGLVIGIHMDEFRRAIEGKPGLTEWFGTPYAACFQWLVQSMLYLQARSSSRERLAIVHETNNYQREALEAFEFIRTKVNPFGTKMTITFGGKDDYPPLQAADILAYEGNKRMRAPDRPERKPWQILNPDKRILAAHYGKHNMPTLIGNLERIKAGAPVNISDQNWRTFLRSAPIAAQQ